jgi:hypothetical protein
MVFTRNKAKQQQQQQNKHQYEFPVDVYTITLLPSCNTIDFIDASIEWRKNKIKRDNCTFEYTKKNHPYESHISSNDRHSHSS